MIAFSYSLWLSSCMACSPSRCRPGLSFFLMPILLRKVVTIDDMAEKNRTQGKSKKAMTKKERLKKKKDATPTISKA